MINKTFAWFIGPHRGWLYSDQLNFLTDYSVQLEMCPQKGLCADSLVGILRRDLFHHAALKSSRCEYFGECRLRDGACLEKIVSCHWPVCLSVSYVPKVREPLSLTTGQKQPGTETSENLNQINLFSTAIICRLTANVCATC